MTEIILRRREYCLPKDQGRQRAILGNLAALLFHSSIQRAVLSIQNNPNRRSINKDQEIANVKSRKSSPLLQGIRSGELRRVKPGVCLDQNAEDAQSPKTMEEHLLRGTPHNADVV